MKEVYDVTWVAFTAKYWNNIESFMESESKVLFSISYKIIVYVDNSPKTVIETYIIKLTISAEVSTLWTSRLRNFTCFFSILETHIIYIVRFERFLQKVTAPATIQWCLIFSSVLVVVQYIFCSTTGIIRYTHAGTLYNNMWRFSQVKIELQS